MAAGWVAEMVEEKWEGGKDWQSVEDAASVYVSDHMGSRRGMG